MDLPLNVQTGLVTGRYIVDVVDGPDENLDPDAQPVRGQIVFTASVPYLPNPTAAPDPVTIMRVPIVGVLDADGYLCTPYAGTLEPLYRGVRLIATDDPDIAVTDWTWDVTYIFDPINGHKLAIPAHGFALPSDGTIDLTKVAKIPSSPGYSLPQAEAAVLRAEAIAQSIRDDADAGLFNGEAATLQVGTVTSGTTAEVVNVGDEQNAVLNITLEKGDKGDTGNGVPDAGEAFQLIRMDEIAGTTEWVTPTKELVGLTQVDNTSDYNKPISNLTGQALQLKADASVVSDIAPEDGVRAVGKGELLLNVLDHGVVGDGVADDSIALNAASAAASTLGARLFVPPGTYKITDTVRFTTDTQVSAGAVFEYYGTGTALVMGDPTKILFNLDMQAPNVKYKTDTVWGTASVGVELVNLNTCTVLLRTSLGFRTGFRFIGRGGGFAYNTITLGYSNQNRIGHHLTQDETGWCNQNTFIGGRIQLVAGIWGATTDDAGAHYFLFEQGSVGISGPNNNTFVNCTMEGGAQAYHRIKFLGARYNTFLNCRYENYGSTYRVGYFQGSSANRIDGGYDVWKIVEEFDATSTGGSIRDGLGGMFNTSGINTTTLVNGVMTRLANWVAPTMRRVSYDSQGRFIPRAGRWRIEAVITFEANATGYRRAFLATSGGVTIDSAEMTPSAGTRTQIRLSAVRAFNGVESVHVNAQQNSGGDLALTTSVGYARFSGELLDV